MKITVVPIGEDLNDDNQPKQYISAVSNSNAVTAHHTNNNSHHTANFHYCQDQEDNQVMGDPLLQYQKPMSFPLNHYQLLQEPSI